MAKEEPERMNVELDQRVGERTTELEAANRELEAFTYAVSHDLRVPLRAIDGFSLALAEDYAGRLDGEADVYFRNLRGGAQAMGRLIDDFPRLSRISRSEKDRQDTDLSKLVAEVASQLKRSDPHRNVRFDIAPDVVVNADPRLMRIALENIVGNAWKFSAGTPEACIEFGRRQE